MMTRSDLRWIGGLLGLALVVGGVCGWIWLRVVPLPSYTLGPDHFATMSEHGHTAVFAADGWFAVLGLGAGTLLGWLAWSWLRHLGWGIAVLAWVTGLVSGVAASFLGTLFGPRNFAQRLAFAEPGDRVPIDFEIHSPAVLLIWALAATLPVLVGAVLRVVWPRGIPWPDLPSARARTSVAGVSEARDLRERVRVEPAPAATTVAPRKLPPSAPSTAVPDHRPEEAL